MRAPPLWTEGGGDTQRTDGASDDARTCVQSSKSWGDDSATMCATKSVKGKKKEYFRHFRDFWEREGQTFGGNSGFKYLQNAEPCAPECHLVHYSDSISWACKRTGSRFQIDFF